MRVRPFIAALATATTLVCGGAVLPGTALSAAPAGAGASEEGALLALTNQVRASVGAPALSMDDSISAVARSWAQTMAAQGAISHNPSISSQIHGWSGLAENVGVGSGVDQVHHALVASPSHYENLSNPAYSLVGIGVATAGGRLYVVEDFEQPAGGGRRVAAANPEPPTVARHSTTTGAPAPAPAPGPAAVPAPRPTTPPPTSSATTSSATTSSASALTFVLDTLRALDALNGHH